MLSSAEIKKIRFLKDKKQREEFKLFVVEGEKMVEQVAKRCKNKGIYTTNPIGQGELISQKQMEQISQFKNHSEILGVFEMLPKKEFDPNIFENGFTLVLDGVQDPGNFGGIIRSALWFGVKKIVCSLDCADLYNQKTLQSTMGAFLGVEVYYMNLIDFFNSIDKKILVWGTFMEGYDYTKVDFGTKGVIVMGSEGNGIREYLQPFIKQKVTIIDYSKSELTESLNVSVATGLLLQKVNLR